MRLIDANEFKKRIDHYPAEIRDIVKKELRYVPTIDAIQVVRCKDCEYSSEYNHCAIFATWNKPDDYCSYGEKTEVNE